jgi:hypothetical protein
MTCVAVIGVEPVPESHWPLFEKLADLLTKRGVMVRYQRGPAGDLFSKFFRGRFIYGFWHENDDSGIRVYVNPDAGNLRPVMIRGVKEYMRLPKDDKKVAMATMAALYALEGPGFRDADFAITFDATNQGNKVPMLVASKVGTKVYNIADRNQLKELASKLKS